MNVSTTNTTTIWKTSYEELSQVSSLYGPGTVLGFYLSLIGVIISGFRKRDTTSASSISSDLVTVMTFPIFAFAHIFWLRKLPSLVEGSSNEAYELAILQHYFNIQAPIIVVRTYMAFGHNLLFCWASGNKSLLLTCISNMCTMLGLAFWGPLTGRKQSNDLSSSATTDPILKISKAGDSALSSALFTFSMTMGLSERLKTISAKLFRSKRDEDVDQPARQRLSTILRRSLLWTTGILFPTLASIAFDYWPFSSIELEAHAHDVEIKQNGFIRRVFPRTNYSLTDLDQLVAVAAGVIVLAFNLFQLLADNFKRDEQGEPRLAAFMKRRCGRIFHRDEYDGQSVNIGTNF